MSIYKGNKLIAGGSNKPDRLDWDHSVIITSKTLYLDGYVIPRNGIIVGWFLNNRGTAVITLEVNGIRVARASSDSGAVISEGSVQCPVNKYDEIAINTPEGIASAESIVSDIRFVPYKAQ